MISLISSRSRSRLTSSRKIEDGSVSGRGYSGQRRGRAVAAAAMSTSQRHTSSTASQREKLRNMKIHLPRLQRDVVDSYLDALRLARQGKQLPSTYSVGGLILSNSGAITANYWLSEIYDDEIAQRPHATADLHLHDLSMLTGYCAGWSLKQLIQEGLGGIPGKINLLPGKPPLHSLQPDGQLPRHHAERVGRRSGLLQLRHLPRPLRQGRQPQLQRGQAVHPDASSTA